MSILGKKGATRGEPGGILSRSAYGTNDQHALSAMARQSAENNLREKEAELRAQEIEKNSALSRLASKGTVGTNDVKDKHNGGLVGGFKSFVDKSGIGKDLGYLADAANTVFNAPGDAIRKGTELMRSGTKSYLDSDLSKRISKNLPPVNTDLFIGAKKAAEKDIPGVTTGPVANFARGYADMFDFGTGRALDEAFGNEKAIKGRNTKAAKAGEIAAIALPAAGAAKSLAKWGIQKGTHSVLRPILDESMSAPELPRLALPAPSIKPTGRPTQTPDVIYGNDPVSPDTGPLTLPEPNIGEPTTGRVAQRTTVNTYRQKYEALIAEAKRRGLDNPQNYVNGRTLEGELESLWSQMAGKEDPNLQDLIALAHPEKVSKLNPDILSQARERQRLREVAGAPSPVKSFSDRFNGGVTGQAAAPVERVGRAPGVAPKPFAPEPTQTSAKPVKPVQGVKPLQQPKSLAGELLDTFRKIRGEQVPETIALQQPKPVETTSSAPEEVAATAEAKMQDTHAEEDKRNWFTTLFGKRGVGITAGGGADLKSGTQQQIVDSPIKRDIKGAAASVTEAAKQSYRVTTDALQPIKEHFGQEAYDIAMDSNRSDNLASQIIHGQHFVDMQGVRRGKSLKSVMKMVPRGLDNEAIDYLILRDAKARVGRGEMVYEQKHNMDTVENIQAKIDQYEKRHKWTKNFGEEWDKFNKNIRTYYGLEGDLLNESQIKAMEETRPNYAPQRRQFSLSERIKQNFGKKGMGFSGQKAPIHEVSEAGSRRKIVDPRRTLIESTQQWAHNAMMNRVMVHIGDEVAANPEAWKGIATIVRDDKHTASKYAKAFADADEMKKAADSGDMEEFMDTMTHQFRDFMKAKSGDDHILTYMKKGQPVRIRVENVDAIKALASLSPQQLGPIVRFLSFNSKLIKESATGLLSPMFAAKQFTVDLPQALIQSQRPIQHLGNFVHALASSVADAVPGLNRTRLAKLAQDYAEAGGKFSMIQRSEKGLSKSLDGLKRHALLSPQGVAQGVKTVVKSPFTALHKFGDVFENTNRIAAAKPYLQMERTPENVRNAMNAGREATVNYSRRGSAYMEMEAAIPYTNAAIQGLRKVIVNAKENPVKTAIAMTALVILPKLYEYSQFGNDPDYQKIPARNRYRNLIVYKKSDGKFVQIPMPPEYEAVGAIMFDMLRRYHDGDKTVTNGSITDAMINAYTPPLVTGATEGITKGTGVEGSVAGVFNSTSLAPVLGATFNRSFTGAPIVPQRLQSNSPGQQYDERTSDIAKAIGQKIGMSPMKVDYLIRSYGGDPARLINPIFSPVGSGTPKDVLLKNFVVDPVFTNTLSDDYYSMKEKIAQAESDNRTNGVPFPKWYNPDVADYVTTTRKGSISKQITELTSQKRDIRASTLLTASEKTQKLRDIQAQINLLYLDAVTKMKEGGVP